MEERKEGPHMLTRCSLSSKGEKRTWFYPLRVMADIDLCEQNMRAQTNMQYGLARTSAQPYALWGQLTGQLKAPWKHPSQSLISLPKPTSAPQCLHPPPPAPLQALISKSHPLFLLFITHLLNYPTSHNISKNNSKPTEIFSQTKTKPEQQFKL